MQGKGKCAAVLLPLPLCIAEGESNIYSLVDAGGGREGVDVGADRQYPPEH